MRPELRVCVHAPIYAHEFAACASPRQHLRLTGIGCADAALLPTGLAIELGHSLLLLIIRR